MGKPIVIVESGNSVIIIKPHLELCVMVNKHRNRCSLLPTPCSGFRSWTPGCSVKMSQLIYGQISPVLFVECLYGLFRVHEGFFVCICCSFLKNKAKVTIRKQKISYKLYHWKHY